MVDCRTDVAHGLALIGFGQGLVQQRRSCWNIGLISQYELDAQMPEKERRMAWREPHDRSRWVTVVDWLFKKVSDWLPYCQNSCGRSLTRQNYM